MMCRHRRTSVRPDPVSNRRRAVPEPQSVRFLRSQPRGGVRFVFGEGMQSPERRPVPPLPEPEPDPASRGPELPGRCWRTRDRTTATDARGPSRAGSRRGIPAGTLSARRAGTAGDPGPRGRTLRTRTRRELAAHPRTWFTLPSLPANDDRSSIAREGVRPLRSRRRRVRCRTGVRSPRGIADPGGRGDPLRAP